MININSMTYILPFIDVSKPSSSSKLTSFYFSSLGLKGKVMYDINCEKIMFYNSTKIIKKKI